MYILNGLSTNKIDELRLIVKLKSVFPTQHHFNITKKYTTFDLLIKKLTLRKSLF